MLRILFQALLGYAVVVGLVLFAFREFHAWVTSQDSPVYLLESDLDQT